MKKFISGAVTGAILTGSIALAASYVAEPATFKVLVNGKDFTSDPPALVVNGSTYLPLRAVGDALGVPVNWNAELNQAEVGNSAPVAEKDEYSRTNPAPINTVQTYTSTGYSNSDNYTVAIRVLEVVRGEEAVKALKEQSKMTTITEDDYELINIKLAFSVISTDGDYHVTPSQSDFEIFSSNNEGSPMHMWKSISPALDDGPMYEGANRHGWITLKVRKDDPNPKLAYGLDYYGQNGIWFSLN